jgi:hypothetical protein
MKNIYYYSALAAENYGFKIAEDPYGNKIKFTGLVSENNPSEYQWDDKLIIGIFESEEIKLLEVVAPKTNREKIEEQFNLINKDKKSEQILEESFNRTTNIINKEKKKMEKEQSAKILAIRAIYNIASPKSSLRFKK